MRGFAFARRPSRCSQRLHAGMLVSGIRIDLIGTISCSVRRCRESQGSNTPEPFITSLHREISARIYFTMTRIGSFILIDWSNTGSATGLRHD
jgi:hypothetical protein